MHLMQDCLTLRKRVRQPEYLVSIAYKWKEKDEEFRKQWEEVEEAFKDKLETVMFSKALTEQDNTMLIWLSKTKMRERGYVERLEQEVTVNPFEKLMQELPDDEE